MLAFALAVESACTDTSKCFYVGTNDVPSRLSQALIASRRLQSCQTSTGLPVWATAQTRMVDWSLTATTAPDCQRLPS